MNSTEVPYTTPGLFKPKTIDLVPKGSTKAKEEAKLVRQSPVRSFRHIPYSQFS
jgi:hypothetical protein